MPALHARRHEAGRESASILHAPTTFWFNESVRSFDIGGRPIISHLVMSTRNSPYMRQQSPAGIRMRLESGTPATGEHI